jgi:hypothetical protein
MFGESGASAKNCIWSVALTQWARAKAIVVKLERRCQDEMRESHAAWRSAGLSHLRAADIGVRRILRDDSCHSRSWPHVR